MWEINENGDYVATRYNKDLDKYFSIEKEALTQDEKINLAKNFESKMILYHSLPIKEYESFMFKTTNEI